jgi:hypothetical protein
VSICWFREQCTWTVISEGSGQNIEHAAALKNLVDFLQSLFDITAADIVECSVIGCSKRLQVAVCLWCWAGQSY